MADADAGDDDEILYYMEDGDNPVDVTTAAATDPNKTLISSHRYGGAEDKRQVYDILPVFIALPVLAFLALLANMVVCYIYRCRSRRATSNFLVIFFAIFDISGSVLGVSTVLLSLALPYKHEVSAVCNITAFVETISVCSICLTLVVAAYICYRQVCCSASGGGVKWARRYCLMALALSVLISVPASIVHSIRPVRTAWGQVIGYDCGLDHGKPSWVLHLHHVLVLGCFAFSLALIALFFSLVSVWWCKQKQAQCSGEKPGSTKQKQFPKKHRFVREDTSSSSTTSYSEEIGRLHTARNQCHSNTPHHHYQHHHHHHSHHHHSHHSHHTYHNHYHYSHHQQHYDPARVPLKSGCHDSTGGGGRGIIKSTSSSGGVVGNSNFSEMSSTNQTPTSPVAQLHVTGTRQALIFMVVSLVFMFVMVPWAVVTVLIATTNVFQRFSSNTTEVIVRLCLRSYLLNYLMKPIIYIIINVKFRRELKQLVSKLWALCPNRTETPAPQTRTNSRAGSVAASTPHWQMRSTSNSSIYRPSKTVI